MTRILVMSETYPLSHVKAHLSEIVDLVESGNTLKANGLVPLEHMHDISSRLVVNKASWKMKHSTVQALVNTLREAVGT